MHHSTSRALRRALILVVVGVPTIFALACSQATSHPPISGDCVGELCPPAQPRQTGPGGGGATDATTTGETGTGTPDAGVPEAAGPNEAGNFPDVNVFPDVGID